MNFVFETLCSENNFISDIYEDLCYIFGFGYYLKRNDFVATLVCTLSSMDTDEKETGYHNLSQGRTGSSQKLFEVGEEILKFEFVFSFVHGLNYMPSS